MRRFLAAVLICHSLAVLSPNAARAEELVVTVGQYFHPQATDQQRARLQMIVKQNELGLMREKGFIAEHACVVDKFTKAEVAGVSVGTNAISLELETEKRAGNFDKNAVTIIRNVVRKVFLKCQEDGHVTPGAGKP